VSSTAFTKKGSIDVGTVVVPSLPNRVCVAESTLRRYVAMPLGKFAGSGVLLAQNVP
jgi:hypothetical protein